MPTYKNPTKTQVSFDLRLYQNNGIFRRGTLTIWPGEERPLHFALPFYAEKGLVLVNPYYPPLPDPVIINNELEYRNGVSREFQIRPCDRYLVQIITQSGRVKCRFGPYGTAFELDADSPKRFMFIKKVSWENAPMLIIEGIGETSTCSLHVEELQAGELGGVMD